jgi:alpha-amylase/alpha-mannosidase (GH57 family)
MKKFICIHGHFYQPPRENPWTGEVDEEPSANPFHNWNERIAKECYEANTRAPILNSHGEVVTRVNNFSRMSFDIGPTLLSWLLRKDPSTYKGILEADRASVLAHGGHGNAMAQIYNHIIMPLASKRDKITQVRWGIRDFEFHYKRKPEGMWLSETAVDRETLNILIDHGILFTVLAPHQARRVRHVGFGSRWVNMQGEGVNPRHPYRVILDRGRQFHVFFYDAPISRAIAFEGLLHNGDKLAHKLLNAFGSRDREQLVSTATDGESFGHHHRFGEMALAYSMKKIEDHHLAQIANYGEFLGRFGSFWEADIHDNSSWSCAHGVERWRSDCGCRIQHGGGWNQKWRAHLREAFDFLKEVIDQLYERKISAFAGDPWEVRNDYISVILDPAEKRKKEFLSRHAKRTLTAEEEKMFWELLEAEKFALFMYTSCGWFFDDISGIEPVQVMKFAARAIELASPYNDKNIETPFLRMLGEAKSNYAEQGTGADIFMNLARAVRPSLKPAGDV